jgi:hypothetical protein
MPFSPKTKFGSSNRPSPSDDGPMGPRGRNRAIEDVVKARPIGRTNAGPKDQSGPTHFAHSQGDRLQFVRVHNLNLFSVQKILG